jgi:hypothetical protein
VFFLILGVRGGWFLRGACLIAGGGAPVAGLRWFLGWSWRSEPAIRWVRG